MSDLISDIKYDRDSEDHREVELSGITIGKTLIRAANSLGLNFQNLVGQRYDGVAAMADERIVVALTPKNCRAHGVLRPAQFKFFCNTSS